MSRRNNLDNDNIEQFLDCPMSSEADQYQHISSDEEEHDLGNISSEYVDDTDEDPDFAPSQSEDSSMEEEEAMEVSANESDLSQVNTENDIVNNGSDNDDDWGTYEGKQKVFPFTTVSKFNFNLPYDATPIDYYEVFLTDDIIEMMVLETNKNANNVLRDVRLNRSSRLKKWRPTNADEMKKFLGILMWMGLAHFPRITDYWSKSVLYNNSVANQVMSRNRFQVMLRFWHFNDNARIEQDGRISKILPLITKLNELFLSKRSADQDLIVDESMIPFRGRLYFRQYIPNKTHKYGLKIFKLCDKLGYTFCTKLYMGKGTVVNENNAQVSTLVVMELMANHTDKGHRLYVDNYYTSIPLAKQLLEKNTHLTGTLRANRKGLPDEVMKAKIKKGDMVALETTDGIVVSKWKDKREVRMLSTVHGVDYVDTGKKDKKNVPILKPLVITEYNKSKMGIDLSDQMASYSTGVRKSRRWYHKVAEEMLLGTAVVNSWLAYTDMLKARPSGNGRQTKHAMSITSYKEKVAKSLMGLKEEIIPPVKTTGHHYLSVSENFIGEGKTKHRIRKYCKLCYKKTVERRGRQGAKNLGKVNTFCDKFPEKPYLCKDCFREIHK